MFSHQARINTRTIRKDRLTPTTRAAIQLGCDLAMFIVFAFAVLLMADGYMRLASGDLQAIHAQAEELRGW
jgi:hypothetical protein